MNQLKVFLCSLFCTVLILSACSEKEWSEPFQDRLQIAVTDSIGIENGDSCYVLGKIADAAVTPEGTVLILDESDMCLREYSVDGEFLRNLSRSGYGPGETGMPSEIAVMPDGRLLVWDFGKLSINMLAPDGESIEDVSDFSLFPPISIGTLENDLFTGIEFTYDMPSDNQVLIIIRPSVFLVGCTEPEVILFSDTLSFSPSDRISSSPDGLMGMVLAATDGHDRIFYTRKSPSDYRVYCWNSCGEELFTAQLNIPPVEKTPEEIADEEQYISMMLGFADPGYSLNPCHDLVEGLGVDRDGNLWVQRGTEDPAVFDVFNTNGAHIGTAEFPITGRFWEFSITRFGALAWNCDPEDGFQKVYMLWLPEF